MADKKFIVAIGGTGMRCLEAFVHLCAIGMFDNEEIEILTLDTDQTNGNKDRVEQLIDLYNHVKSNDPAQIDGGKPNADTFFSAKLNLYKFCTDYTSSQRSTYANLAQLSTGDSKVQKDNQALSDLFLERDTVQDFKLDHGYRAQTHLGSYLMYHAIIEAALRLRGNEDEIKEEEKSFRKFLLKLLDESDNARVFVFGSVFGGTGASSIPVIPVAFRDAVHILDGSSTLDLKKVKFGSTLLTEYFSFKKPTPDERKSEHIIADSTFFPINSQAAMQFYQDDPTVKMCYRRLYHVGWPLESRPLDNRGHNAQKTITGGNEQRNNCHVVELLSACAACDFFYQEDDSLNNAAAVYLYKSAPFDGSSFAFTGRDFVGSKLSQMFEAKLGAFFSFAHIVLGRQGGASNARGTKGLVERLSMQNTHDYDSLKLEQLVDIDKYLQQFAYFFNNRGELVLGWIYQVYNSVMPGKFMFRSDAFEMRPGNIGKVDPGNLYEDSSHSWDNGGLFGLGSRYDKFISGFAENVASRPQARQKANTLKEKLLAHMYNAIQIAQKTYK